MTDFQLREYYEGAHDEAERLRVGAGRLEFVRTVELLGRYLPKPPARVIDVGGGTGIYSARLASDGYEVELVDPVPSHVAAASGAGGFEAKLGDARSLLAADHSFDAALLLGPLYHLRSRADRLAALCEARRVVRAGGAVFVAFISRGSVFLDGFVKGWVDDPGALAMMADVARSGSSGARSGFGAVAYFHSPEEARSELSETGLEVIDLVGVEGPGWVACDLEERWNDPAGRETLLESARAAEASPELVGLSAHLLAVCRSP